MKRLLYIILLAFLLTACGKAETNNKKEQVETKQTAESSDNQVDNTESSEEKDEDSQSTVDASNDDEVQEPGNQAESNANQSNKNETTTKPSTGNTDSNKKPSTGSTTKPSTGSTGNTQNNNGGTTTQPVHEHNWVEVTEDEIHYYAWRTICNVCNADITDLGSEGIINHTFECGGASYANYYKEVDFVTENIVKTPVVTGYKCECGAEKNK